MAAFWLLVYKIILSAARHITAMYANSSKKMARLIILFSFSIGTMEGL